MTETWLLLDAGFPVDAYRELERAGLPVVHAGVEGLASEGARELLEYAIADGCVIVTRNYADFTRLAEAYTGAGRSFPGILLVSPELDATDAAASARAVEAWYRRRAKDASTERNGLFWLGSGRRAGSR